MTRQEILASLESFSETFPKRALREAQKKMPEITADLLGALDNANRNAQELYEEENDYYLHIYVRLKGKSRENNDHNVSA